MLVLPLRPAVRFDIQSALMQWLDSDEQVFYQSANPLQFVIPKPDFTSDACRDELIRLQSLRNCVADALLKPDSHKHALEESALEDCHEYHAALLEFEKRGFPTIDDHRNGVMALPWKGAWAPQQEKHATLIWDRANVMFNIVALMTFKAAECGVTDRMACKEAVGYCQNAASILVILKELLQSQNFGTVDMSQSMLLFWERYLMAEAQTFVYRMASLANNDANHSSLSCLAQSSHKLFSEALSAAQDPRLESEVPRQEKVWGAYCKTHSMLSSAKAEYHQAVVHRVAHEWGKEIARLRECIDKFEACSSFIKSLDDDSIVTYAKRECSAILPVVKDRLAEADKDNYQIYQDEIPKTVGELTAKQLAKNTGGLPQTMLVPKKPLFVNL